MLVEMLLPEIRKQSGLTQKEVAVALGISQRSLSKIENQDDMQVGNHRSLPQWGLPIDAVWRITDQSVEPGHNAVLGATYIHFGCGDIRDIDTFIV